MCGIAGIIPKNNHQGLLKSTLFAMSRSIKHRGSDGEGFVFFDGKKVNVVSSNETPEQNLNSTRFLFNPSQSIDNIGQDFVLAFAHRRLSIIDLSESGHQPMCDNSGNYWITFNGEIYNYLELKLELEAKGHIFITKSDTEVVIAAYKEWGNECLSRFNGMFAFALLDTNKNIVFCARDRAGVKPFYYSETSQGFAFASEYKAFIASKFVSFDINEAQQFDFIINANLENDSQSLFKGINELKPAHYLTYDLISHHYTSVAYYNFKKPTTIHLSENEIIEQIELKLLKALKLRLRSDVEVGSCLSGGLDSSIIAGIVKHIQPQHPLKLFSVVFPGERFDEAKYAELVSKHINGIWNTITPTPNDFFKEIEQLNYYQDLPIWSTSTYSQHRVMQLAHEHNIKVVLDGQGADELFAGYAHHYMALWNEKFDIKSIHKSKQTIPNPYSLYAKQLLKDAFDLGFNFEAYFIDTEKQYTKSKNEKIASNLNQQLQNDYRGRLKSFLKCEDRCSMAFGIESRVPFADDVELFDFMFSIEGNLKIKNGISKYVLREATQKYIPKEIYQRRDKIGFDTPTYKWFLPQKKQVLDVISQNKFIATKTLHKNYEKLLSQKPNFILRLYSFSIWKKAFSSL